MTKHRFSYTPIFFINFKQDVFSYEELFSLFNQMASRSLIENRSRLAIYVFSFPVAFQYLHIHVFRVKFCQDSGNFSSTVPVGFITCQNLHFGKYLRLTVCLFVCLVHKCILGYYRILLIFKVMGQGTRS